MPHLVNGRLRKRATKPKTILAKSDSGGTATRTVKKTAPKTGTSITVTAEERAHYEALARSFDERAKYEQHLPQDMRRR